MAGILELQNLQVQRVVSKLAAGVRWGQQFIYDQVCAMVNTGSENFAYSSWGNEGLRDVETRRALDGEPNKFTAGSGTVTGELEEHTIETYYDLRKLKAAAEAGNQDIFRQNYSAMLRLLVTIQKEKQCATLCFTSTNYESGFTVSDVNFSSTGIRDKVLAAKDLVSERFGVVPDTFIAGKTTHRFLLKNPDIIDAIKYSKGGITTEQLIAEFLEVGKYVRGRAVTQPPAVAGQPAASSTNLWTADVAALIYTGAASEADENGSNSDTVSPSFCKHFYTNSPASGSPVLVRTWLPDPGLVEHQIYSEFFKIAQIMKAGYLWTNTDQA